MVALRCLLLSAAFAIAAALPARADQSGGSNREQARQLAGEAMDLVRAGDLDAALDKFQRADVLLPAPTIRNEIAKLLEQKGSLKAAAEAYRAVIAMTILPSDPAVHHEARAEAVERLRLLLADMPRLTVETSRQSAVGIELRVNGRPARVGQPLELEQGPHDIELRDGPRIIRRRVLLARGDKKVERISLPDATAASKENAQPEAGQSAWAPVGWTLLAIGGAGLIVFGVAGGIGLAAEADLEARCGGSVCPPALEGEVNQFERAKLASSIGLAIGVAGVALAVPPLVIAATRDDAAKISVVVGPLGAGLQGHF